MRALKYGHSATISVDIGQGPNVGITFESTNTGIATVDAYGVVTPVVNPPLTVNFYVIIREATSTVVLAKIDFLVVPEAVPEERLTEVNTGSLVFTEVTDTSGPEGGSLSASFNGTQLVVNFTSPTDSDSGISGLFLTVASSDLTDIRANKLNILGLSSPRYFNVEYGKIYIVTLRAINADGLIRDITASVEIPNGWNRAPWNLSGFGL